MGQSRVHLHLHDALVAEVGVEGLRLIQLVGERPEQTIAVVADLVLLKIKRLGIFFHFLMP